MKDDKKQPDTDDTKQQISVYIPGALFERLANYMHDKLPGRMTVRNQIIVDAISEKLEREGY